MFEIAGLFLLALFALVLVSLLPPLLVAVTGFTLLALLISEFDPHASMRNLLDSIIYFIGSAWLIYLAIWIVCAALDIFSRKIFSQKKRVAARTKPQQPSNTAVTR